MTLLNKLAPEGKWSLRGFVFLYCFNYSWLRVPKLPIWGELYLACYLLVSGVLEGLGA
jgi:hypothetical protein